MTIILLCKTVYISRALCDHSISQSTLIAKNSTIRRQTSEISTMKLFVAIFAILAAFACTSAFVLPDGFNTHQSGRIVRLEDVDTDGGIHASPDDSVVRQRRFTCDFFSFESSVVTPNHAACALKCVGKGRGGGHCEGTTCICRNDKWVPW